MSLAIAAYDTVNLFRPGGATALAPLMGKSPTTLSHEVDPHYAGAKLGLEDALKLMVLTRDLRMLEAMAQALGCVVVPLHAGATSEPETMEALGRSAKEFAEFIAATAAAWGDGAVTENELDTMEREAADLLGMVSALLGLARARHVAGKPEGRK